MSGQDNAVNLTRAYTNPMNGVQSIAFYDHVTVLDEKSNERKDALLMRVVPLPPERKRQTEIPHKNTLLTAVPTSTMRAAA